MANEDVIEQTHELIRRMPMTPLMCVLDHLKMKTEMSWYTKNKGEFREMERGPFKSSKRAETTLKVLQKHIWEVNSIGGETTGVGYQNSGCITVHLNECINRAVKNPELAKKIFEEHYTSRLHAYRGDYPRSWSRMEEPVYKIGVLEAVLLRQVLWRAYATTMVNTPLPDDLTAVHVPAIGSTLLVWKSVYNGHDPLSFFRASIGPRVPEGAIWVMASKGWGDVMQAVQLVNNAPPGVSTLLAPYSSSSLGDIAELMYRYKRGRVVEDDLIKYPDYIQDLDSDDLPPYTPIEVGF